MNDRDKTPAELIPEDMPRLLRIVPSVETAAKEKDRPGRNNPFVQFMTAYADSIDDEIKAILEL